MNSALVYIAELLGGIPDTFTPEWMDNVWFLAEDRKHNGVKGLMELHWITDDAERCALWMRQHKIASTAYIGPFRPNPFKVGQTVFIPKDSSVLYRGEVKKTRQGRNVRIAAVFEGYTDSHHGVRVVNPMISWAGSGGYWTDYDLGLNTVVPTNATR